MDDVLALLKRQRQHLSHLQRIDDDMSCLQAENDERILRDSSDIDDELNLMRKRKRKRSLENRYVNDSDVYSIHNDAMDIDVVERNSKATEIMIEGNKVENLNINLNMSNKNITKEGEGAENLADATSSINESSFFQYLSTCDMLISSSSFSYSNVDLQLLRTMLGKIAQMMKQLSDQMYYSHSNRRTEGSKRKEISRDHFNRKRFVEAIANNMNSYSDIGVISIVYHLHISQISSLIETLKSLSELPLNGRKALSLFSISIIKCYYCERYGCSGDVSILINDYADKLCKILVRLLFNSSIANGDKEIIDVCVDNIMNYENSQGGFRLVLQCINIADENKSAIVSFIQRSLLQYTRSYCKVKKRETEQNKTQADTLGDREVQITTEMVCSLLEKLGQINSITPLIESMINSLILMKMKKLNDEYQAQWEIAKILIQSLPKSISSTLVRDVSIKFIRATFSTFEGDNRGEQDFENKIIESDGKIETEEERYIISIISSLLVVKWTFNEEDQQQCDDVIDENDQSSFARWFKEIFVTGSKALNLSPILSNARSFQIFTSALVSNIDKEEYYALQAYSTSFLKLPDNLRKMKCRQQLSVKIKERLEALQSSQENKLSPSSARMSAPMKEACDIILKAIDTFAKTGLIPSSVVALKLMRPVYFQEHFLACLLRDDHMKLTSMYARYKTISEADMKDHTMNFVKKLAEKHKMVTPEQLAAYIGKNTGESEGIENGVKNVDNELEMKPLSKKIDEKRFKNLSKIVELLNRNSTIGMNTWNETKKNFLNQVDIQSNSNSLDDLVYHLFNLMKLEQKHSTVVDVQAHGLMLDLSNVSFIEHFSDLIHSIMNKYLKEKDGHLSIDKGFACDLGLGICNINDMRSVTSSVLMMCILGCNRKLVVDNNPSLNLVDYILVNHLLDSIIDYESLIHCLRVGSVLVNATQIISGFTVPWQFVQVLKLVRDRLTHCSVEYFHEFEELDLFLATCISTPVASEDLITFMMERLLSMEIGIALRNDGFDNVLMRVEWIISKLESMNDLKSCFAFVLMFYLRNACANRIQMDQEQYHLWNHPKGSRMAAESEIILVIRGLFDKLQSNVEKSILFLSAIQSLFDLPEEVDFNKIRGMVDTLFPNGNLLHNLVVIDNIPDSVIQTLAKIGKSLKSRAATCQSAELLRLSIIDSFLYKDIPLALLDKQSKARRIILKVFQDGETPNGLDFN